MSWPRVWCNRVRFRFPSERVVEMYQVWIMSFHHKTSENPKGKFHLSHSSIATQCSWVGTSMNFQDTYIMWGSEHSCLEMGQSQEFMWYGWRRIVSNNRGANEWRFYKLVPLLHKILLWTEDYTAAFARQVHKSQIYMFRRFKRLGIKPSRLIIYRLNLFLLFPDRIYGSLDAITIELKYKLSTGRLVGMGRIFSRTRAAKRLDSNRLRCSHRFETTDLWIQ